MPEITINPLIGFEEEYHQIEDIEHTGIVLFQIYKLWLIGGYKMWNFLGDIGTSLLSIVDHFFTNTIDSSVKSKLLVNFNPTFH